MTGSDRVLQKTGRNGVFLLLLVLQWVAFGASPATRCSDLLILCLIERTWALWPLWDPRTWSSAHSKISYFPEKFRAFNQPIITARAQSTNPVAMILLLLTKHILLCIFTAFNHWNRSTGDENTPIFYERAEIADKLVRTELFDLLHVLGL